MTSSTVYNFNNVINGAFLGTPTSSEPFITFGQIYQMNDIWRVSQIELVSLTLNNKFIF